MPRRGENIHKRSDGRWEGRYIKGYDETGKAKYGSVYAKKYTEAKIKLLEAKKNILNALFEGNSKLILQEALCLWLEGNRDKLKEQTYAKYQRLIDQHITPELGMMQVVNITATDISLFITKKVRNGRLDGKGGLSPSYIKTILFIIKSTLNMSVRPNLSQSISEDVIKPCKNVKKMSVLTMQEQLVLENTILTDCDKRKVGILLSLYAGLRIGEVCGLKWCDVDFEANTIHICRTVERIKNINAQTCESKTKLVIGEPKTWSSNRIVPVPEFLIKLLRDDIDEPDTYVVKGNSYPYTDPRTYQYLFQGYLKRSGLRAVNFHTLRHTFATRCIESGMDIKTLSEILGHSSVNITLNTYVHSSIDQKRLQLNNMAAFCGQNNSL